MAEMKDCPKCGLVNVSTAERCDCGWAFLEGRPKRSLSDCPSCGGSEYTSCKPKGWVAFKNDRKCKACGTRYSLPTPAWAAILFVVAGVAMLLGGIVGLGALVSSDSPNPIGMATTACFAAVGAVAAIHGVRALLRPGKV